ncbi:unnamed protein product [Sphagnum troendelagicum]|uniref:Tubulin/FtsZ GTPase domain-containing protein n=1 Tax=Sphagnum troendelagicum TaxID=128251 RepID=A0ABP0TI48_9BRYO
MYNMRSMSSSSYHLSTTCGCYRSCCFGAEFGEQIVRSGSYSGFCSVKVELRARRHASQLGYVHSSSVLLDREPRVFLAELCTRGENNIGFRRRRKEQRFQKLGFLSFVHTLLPSLERQQRRVRLKGKQECELITCEASLAKDAALLGSPVTWVRTPPIHNHGSNGLEQQQPEATQGKPTTIGRELQIIGVGRKIPAIFNFCSQSPLLSSAEFWRSLQSTSLTSKDFTSNIARNLPFPPPKSGLMLLLQAVAGSTEALDVATGLLQAARDQCCLAVSIVVLPFHFEGQRRRKEAEEAMHILGASSDILIVVEQDALMRQEMVTVAEADCLACTAVLLGIKALSDLLLGDNQVVLDETSYGQQDIDSFEIKSILQQGGKACLGFGKGGSVKAAMGSAALDSPFMHGWLAEEEKGAVLCTVASAAKIEPKEVQEALRLLQDLVGKQQLICTSIQEPSLDTGVVTATIIITRVDDGFVILGGHMTDPLSLGTTEGDPSHTWNGASIEVRNGVDKGVNEKPTQKILKLEQLGSQSGAQSKRSDQPVVSDGKSIPATSNITRPLDFRSEGGVGQSPMATGNAWKAGPSSAAAEEWALSRAQAREQLVAIDPEEETSITIGIRPRVEQQRVVGQHPYQKSAPEVIPVDPAAVPRKGVGAMLDKYRAMLQGRDSSPALAPTTLSQRAASMLENERSTNKLTQVMEIQLNQGLYKGRCQAGQPEGKGRLTYADGSFYEGQWKQGNRHGTGAFYYANGDMYQGSWRNNVMHGQGWLYFHTGDRLHAHYVNGVANGEARYYSVDGNVFFGRLRDNWRHGECLYIESSGSRWREVWDYGMFVSRTPIQDCSGGGSS